MSVCRLPQARRPGSGAAPRFLRELPHEPPPIELLTDSHLVERYLLRSTVLRETEELYRSEEMLSRKEREAKTADETALIGEEKVRQRPH